MLYNVTILRGGGRHICFFGDSHMRHVYNSFVAMTEGTGREDDYWRRERKTDGLVMSAQASSYFRNTWGDPGNMSACTDSFVNFGQAWLASTACLLPLSCFEQGTC